MPNLTFPIPNVTSGPHELLTYSNTVTNNLFSIFILVAIFLVLFINMKTRGFQTEKALVSSAFSITLVSYIMMLIPNLISPEITVIMTMITAVSVLLLYKSGGGGSY